MHRLDISTPEDLEARGNIILDHIEELLAGENYQWEPYSLNSLARMVSATLEKKFYLMLERKYRGYR